MKTSWTLLAIVAALATAPAAYAGGSHGDDDGAAVASLTGENFLASELPQAIGSMTVEGTCNPLGTSTFTFTAEGQATGPYPGTFTESGTVVVEPLIGRAASFDASFAIDSPLGTVTGTKTLGPFAATSLGLCGTGAVPPPAGANAMRFEGTVAYTASIVTPLGRATDSGTSFVNMGDAQVRGLPDFNGFVFSENFTSTSLVPAPDECGGEDDDSQGDNDCQGEDEQ